jgi:hypothetical protein
MDESTDVSAKLQLPVFFRRIDMEFTIVELAALMPMKGTTTDEHLYDVVKKVLRSLESLDIPIRKPAGLVTDRAPSMVGGNSGVS